MVFPDEFAERMKEYIGSVYRPSNGTEGEIFMERYCYSCNHWNNGHCPIAINSIFYDADDSRYPKEWQIGPEGQPICTEFAGNTENSNQTLFGGKK